MKINNPTTTVVFFIAGSAIIFFSVVPRYEEYTYLESKLPEIQSQYADRLDYYKQLTNVIFKIESNEDFLKKMNSALPATDSSSQIISFLQNEAGKNNLNIQSISFSKTSEPANTNIKNIGFTIDLSGEYTDFKKFVNALDTSARLFQVIGISFESEIPSEDPSYANQSGKYYKMEIMAHSY